MLPEWRAKRTRPRFFGAALVLTILAVGLTMYASQPPARALDRHRCDFDTLSVGLPGIKWIKVEPDDGDRGYRLTVRWGPHVATAKTVLNGPTYFTLRKHHLSSPPLDITVEPSAYLSCGSGDPPEGATRTELISEMWHRNNS